MELAYKMFNSDLSCTLGNGRFCYEPGKWYEEPEANCKKNGFHAAKNPLDCLSYYHDFANSQCWAVLLDGDIDEDNIDSKISAQKIMLYKRLSLAEFVCQATHYILDHPMMDYNHNVTKGPAEANNNHFAISVGEKAMARGKKGDVLAILKTYPGSREIESATCILVDDEETMSDVWYGASGVEVKLSYDKTD